MKKEDLIKENEELKEENQELQKINECYNEMIIETINKERIQHTIKNILDTILIALFVYMAIIITMNTIGIWRTNQKIKDTDNCIEINDKIYCNMEVK